MPPHCAILRHRVGSRWGGLVEFCRGMLDLLHNFPFSAPATTESSKALLTLLSLSHRLTALNWKQRSKTARSAASQTRTTFPSTRTSMPSIYGPTAAVTWLRAVRTLSPTFAQSRAVSRCTTCTGTGTSGGRRFTRMEPSSTGSSAARTACTLRTSPLSLLSSPPWQWLNGRSLPAA